MSGPMREMTTRERLDQTIDYLLERFNDLRARHAKEVRWARQQALQEAYAAVASLNGNGHDEPSDPALDAAQAAIRRLLDAAVSPPPTDTVEDGR